LAVGGGSVLDMAKIIKYSILKSLPFTVDKEESEQEKMENIPLIAIPTTAGSGSEVTQFAVLYVNGVKHSIEDNQILPEIVIIDSNLTYSLPARLTAISGMDALCQAIESYWSVNSNTKSKQYAQEAINLALSHIERAVHNPTPAARLAMSKASMLAGKAINISKTTAPHALSYYMTSKLGVPHGHAVSFTLGQFLIFNNEVTDNDISDKRGVKHVKNTMKELFTLMGSENSLDAAEFISKLMKNIGLQTKLKELVVEERINLDEMLDYINYERLNNNPRKISKQQCKNILTKIL
jgi:alcohol dehydrogenase class IV